MTDATSSPLRVRTRTPKRAPEPQYLIDARTMTPGLLAKKYPEEARAYRTLKGRARKGESGFAGFNEFLEHLGPRPSPEHSVDRPRRNDPYSPTNVRWATPKEQANNRSNNRLISIDGVTHNVEQWAELKGVPAATIRSRLLRGWSEREAVTGIRESTRAADRCDDRSLVPAPPGWEATAPRMKSGRPLPYVPRIPQECSDPLNFPIEGWGELFEQDIIDLYEADFQWAASGETRTDFLLLLLGGFGKPTRLEFPSGLIPRIEAHCNPYLDRIELDLLALEKYLDNDPETGEPCWAHPTLSPEDCEQQWQRLTAKRDEALARKTYLLAPYVAVRDELARRRYNDDYGRDGPGLWTFWRSIAKNARRRDRPRRSTEDD